MQLRERDKRTLTVRAFTGRKEDAYTWGEAFLIRAAIYPAQETLEKRITGERTRDERILLYDGPERLKVGMGVCIEAADGEPDYRITALEQWSHQRGRLVRI